MATADTGIRGQGSEISSERADGFSGHRDEIDGVGISSRRETLTIREAPVLATRASRASFLSQTEAKEFCAVHPEARLFRAVSGELIEIEIPGWERIFVLPLRPDEAGIFPGDPGLKVAPGRSVATSDDPGPAAGGAAGGSPSGPDSDGQPPSPSTLIDFPGVGTIHESRLRFTEDGNLAVSLGGVGETVNRLNAEDAAGLAGLAKRENERDALLGQLLFAARDLAQQQFSVTSINLRSGALGPITEQLVFCRACRRTALGKGNKVPHKTGCRVLRVLQSIEKLCALSFPPAAEGLTPDSSPLIPDAAVQQ